MIKRAFDILISGALLVVLSPLLAVISIMIKLDTPGPILFRQPRVGRNGYLFSIRKFRTMYSGSSGAMITVGDDVRITTVGRLLRQKKLDELPQLVDVLSGRMSLVGPRPEVPRYVALWPGDLRDIILSVSPGITDPATIKLRNESTKLSAAHDPERYYTEILLPEKAAAYAHYVRNRSMLGDIRILLHTVLAVIRGR